MENVRSFLKGKKALIIGLGKSGLAAAKLLKSCHARVFLTDNQPKGAIKAAASSPKGITAEFGSHKLLNGKYDLIVPSPGVPWDLPALRRARRGGALVWPELELGWRFVSPAKTVAVTGTNGKTTTTAMVGHIIKTAGSPVVIGGNIGTPLSELIPKIGPKTYLVLEVSSYQLEGHATFHPNVGLFLNLTPDHLGRHGSMKQYLSAKVRLFEHFEKADTAVLNGRDRWCRMAAKKIKGKKVWFPSKRLMELASGTKLPGEHNLMNAMAAAAGAEALGIPASAIKRGIRSFKGVPHRLEYISKINGAIYVNDSKSTNVDSTYVALKSFTRPIILILGGRDKGAPYTPLGPLIRKKVKEIITIGEAHKKIQKDLAGAAPIVPKGTLDNAVTYARQTAESGDVVLLSPACASFDQYENFEHRGRHFVELVRSMDK